MSENRYSNSNDPGSSISTDLGGTTIRAQLLWASFFPLFLFGLLATLVTSAALYQVVLKYSAQQNTAQVQLFAKLVSQDMHSGNELDSEILFQMLQSVKPDTTSQLYLLNSQGKKILDSGHSPDTLPYAAIQSDQIPGFKTPNSQLMNSENSNEKIMVSVTYLSEENYYLVLTEPWDEILSLTNIYQWLFAALWALAIAFSLGMLSVSIRRISEPIAVLVKNATGAVPGSIFHPVLQHGPKEIQALINEFNQMVIRLAEQQSSLRQYAHKTLLSQEEERQRLSHELHDGTLQDMVGLVQRVELCRNDLETNPAYAKQRLDDLHDLLNKTIEDIRRMSIALRPPVLEDFGLSIALDALCKDLKQDKPDLSVKYIVVGENRRLQPDLELAVYRVVQEALSNIRKHVKDASDVSVELRFGNTEIKAVIKNNGAKFSNYDVNRYVQSGHLGLAGMLERARLFGGSLTITMDPELNTVVSIQLPYKQ